MRDVLDVLAGNTSVEAVARHHGLKAVEVEADRARLVSALARSLDQPRSRRGGRFVAALGVIGLILAVVAAPSSAWAQLVTFNANSPAVTADVNSNFQQLRSWLEQKVGTVGTSNITAAGAITTPSLNAGTAAVTGNVTIGGTLTTTGQIFANGGITGNSVVINGVNLRAKPGNDGTVNCDTYCAGAFATFTGSCLGAKLPGGQFTSDCGYSPGLLPNGQQLLCLCATY